MGCVRCGLMMIGKEVDAETNLLNIQRKKRNLHTDNSHSYYWKFWQRMVTAAAMENVNPIEFAMNFHSEFVNRLFRCDFFAGPASIQYDSHNAIARGRPYRLFYIFSSYQFWYILALVWCGVQCSCGDGRAMAKVSQPTHTFHKINPICNLICDISEPKKERQVRKWEIALQLPPLLYMECASVCTADVCDTCVRNEMWTNEWKTIWKSYLYRFDFRAHQKTIPSNIFMYAIHTWLLLGNNARKRNRSGKYGTNWKAINLLRDEHHFGRNEMPRHREAKPPQSLAVARVRKDKSITLRNI